MHVLFLSDRELATLQADNRAKVEAGAEDYTYLTLEVKLAKAAAEPEQLAEVDRLDVIGDLNRLLVTMTRVQSEHEAKHGDRAMREQIAALIKEKKTFEAAQVYRGRKGCDLMTASSYVKGIKKELQEAGQL